MKVILLGELRGKGGESLRAELQAIALLRPFPGLGGGPGRVLADGDSIGERS